jgi:glycosyltransferase involved in cell wall biosynthesis
MMRVSLVLHAIHQYRIPFLEGLREKLTGEKIELDLIYGKNMDTSRKDERNLPWARPVTNHFCGVNGRTICWQDLPGDIYKSGLIILTQGNGFFHSHIVQARARARGIRVALYGHGVCFAAPRKGLANRIKRIYSRRASWWFAYTTGVKQIIAEMGFPPERITVVQNAIDTRVLQERAAKVDAAALEKVRRELGLGPGKVGVYCGGLYEQKRLPFLVESCVKIRESVPGFELIVVGAGLQQGIIQEAAQRYPWLHYVGPKFGANVVPYLKLADVFLMPGLVGLGLLDAFALQKPFVTTSYPYHSPEIEYLDNGQNGVMTGNTMNEYVQGVVHVLTSEALCERIRAGCQVASKKYTIENMRDNYANGIIAALDASPRWETENQQG